MRIEGEHPTLTVRHFFYDWETEVPSSLQIERIGGVGPCRKPLPSIGMPSCRGNWSPWGISFTTT